MKKKKSFARLVLSFAKSFACIPIYQAAFRNTITWGEAIPKVLGILILVIFIDIALSVKEEQLREKK